MHLALPALAGLVLLASAAHASPAGDALQRGRDQMKAGKHAEACAAFAESQKLEPSFGTALELAACHEKTGKLAAALELYRDIADRDTDPTRKATAAAAAKKLEPRVTELRIHLDPPVADGKIFIDGVECTPCLTRPLPVNKGPVPIIIKAPGYKTDTRTPVVDEEGKLVIITVTLEPGTDAAPAVAPPRPAPLPAPTTPRSRQKTYGLITAAGGGVLITTGIVFGVLARSRWNEAQDVCGGSTTCANDSDTDFAQQFADSARTRAHVSSVLFVAGGIATAIGVYLFVTSPKERAVTVSATAAPDGAAVVLGGRF